MAEIHHFEYGWITAVMSYLLSVLGSLLGLLCAGRIRSATSTRQRTWWLLLAAWALGGTAIWTMHFVAMLGFDVTGTQIRYDVPTTVASALLAIVAVGIGLIIVTTGRALTVKVLIGGVITGLGVAAMHYSGMAAMRMHGAMEYDPTRVALSLAIAVVAATVALWLAITVRRPAALIGSALLMGVAVSGMHFTGMTAISVHLDQSVGQLAGATVGTLLVPIVLAVILAVLGLIYALLVAPTDEDRAAAAFFAARQSERDGARAAAEPAPDPAGLRSRSAFQPRGSSTPTRPGRSGR